ncbi:MAG: N-glycosylase/DNA lyase [Candidatus Omnitrophica bacterium]|nr:N-glycosylase/DNA lyase [Candidatus Omnitrophota bacterium]
MTQELKKKYFEKRNIIRKRLKEFNVMGGETDKRIFSELCFCICTPQAKAVNCANAVLFLDKNDILYKGDKKQIRSGLKGVRFPNNKAGYIVETRRLFSDGEKIKIKNRIDPKNIQKTRQWFAENVKGIGYKEASHFLRNIGLGQDLAILDVHVLRNMIKYEVINDIPKNMSKKRYLELENKLRDFSKNINIPMAELDLLFWSNETGKVFR